MSNVCVLNRRRVVDDIPNKVAVIIYILKQL